MNKQIHEWINTGLIALVLILVLVVGKQSDLGATGTRFPNGISADSTSPSPGEVRGTTLTITATSSVNQSVDGMVVGGTISTAATGTVVTVYTNSTGPKVCDASTGYLFVNNNGSFAPSLIWSLGTSTTAVASTNLIASSTVATTTDFYGANLATCQSTNALTWTNGRFGCVAVTTSGPTVFSTTTAQQMSTTTFRTSDGSLPDKTNWEITFVSPKTLGANAITSMSFNGVRTTTYTQSSYVSDGTPAIENTLNGTEVQLYNAATGGFVLQQQHYQIRISNNTGMPVFGDWKGWMTSTTSSHQLGNVREGMFFASTTDAITRIDIGMDDPLAMFGTSTQIQILGW